MGVFIVHPPGPFFKYRIESWPALITVGRNKIYSLLYRRRCREEISKGEFTLNRAFTSQVEEKLIRSIEYYIQQAKNASKKKK